MLQAQGLRTRIEIRVNRILMAIRTAKMGDLYAKHHETASRNTHRSPQRLESRWPLALNGLVYTGCSGRHVGNTGH
jgi:hypothetical protein